MILCTSQCPCAEKEKDTLVFDAPKQDKADFVQPVPSVPPKSRKSPKKVSARDEAIAAPAQDISAPVAAPSVPLLQKLEGPWVRESDRQDVGTVANGSISWGASFSQSPSPLTTVSEIDLFMELLGEQHRAKFEDGPTPRLMWQDGEVWVRPSLVDRVQGAWVQEADRSKVGTIELTILIWESVFMNQPPAKIGMVSGSSISMDLLGETHTGMFSTDPEQKLTWSDGEVWVRPGILEKIDGSWCREVDRVEVCTIFKNKVRWAAGFAQPDSEMSVSDTTITMVMDSNTLSASLEDGLKQRLVWSDGKIWIRPGLIGRIQGDWIRESDKQAIGSIRRYELVSDDQKRAAGQLTVTSDLTLTLALPGQELARGRFDQLPKPRLVWRDGDIWVPKPQ